jgi:hypothetical protein
MAQSALEMNGRRYQDREEETPQGRVSQSLKKVKEIMRVWQNDVIAMTVDLRSVTARAVREANDALEEVERSCARKQTRSGTTTFTGLEALERQVRQLQKDVGAYQEPAREPEAWPERRVARTFRPQQELNPAIYAVGKKGGEYVNTEFWPSLVKAYAKDPTLLRKIKERYETLGLKEAEAWHKFEIRPGTQRMQVYTSFRLILSYAFTKYECHDLKQAARYGMRLVPKMKHEVWVSKDLADHLWMQYGAKINKENENGVPETGRRGRGAWRRPMTHRGAQGHQFGWRRQAGLWTRRDEVQPTREEFGRGGDGAQPRTTSGPRRTPSEAATARGRADGRADEPKATPRSGGKRYRGHSPISSESSESGGEEQAKKEEENSLQD